MVNDVCIIWFYYCMSTCQLWRDRFTQHRGTDDRRRPRQQHNNYTQEQEQDQEQRQTDSSTSGTPHSALETIDISGFNSWGDRDGDGGGDHLEMHTHTHTQWAI